MFWFFCLAAAYCSSACASPDPTPSSRTMWISSWPCLRRPPGRRWRRTREPEGFRVDLHAAPDNPADHTFSLHATKALRLSVPGMKELTLHFKELAKTHGGHYDGWSAAVVPHGAPRL